MSLVPRRRDVRSTRKTVKLIRRDGNLHCSVSGRTARQVKEQTVSLTPVQQGLAGAAGGLIGASAMNAFARVVAAAGGGREARGAAAGVDRDDRGVQPPQATGAADEDATILLGRGVARRLSGHEPSRRATLWLGTFAHMAFGVSVGAVYGVLSARLPTVRSGYGLPFGAAVWALADEGAVPALGLSRKPQEVTPEVHLYALAGHFVFAATLESVVRLVAASRRRAVPGTNNRTSREGHTTTYESRL